VELLYIAAVVLAIIIGGFIVRRNRADYMWFLAVVFLPPLIAIVLILAF
jgi:hypothetical protein